MKNYREMKGETETESKRSSICSFTSYVTATAGAELNSKTTARSFLEVFFVHSQAQTLGSSSAVFSGALVGNGSEVDQLELEWLPYGMLVLARGGFPRYVTTPAPVLEC